MIIDVPVKNADGSLQFTAQAILQFGLNFLMATGLSAAYGVVAPEEMGQEDLPFND